jgi:multidrug efflux pump subunit AcrA (membrane-fusion protein)
MAMMTSEDGNSSGANLTANLPDEIVSSAQGTITDINLVEGVLSDYQNAVVTISKSEDLQAKISVNESNISKIKKGQKVILTGTGFSGSEYAGTVSKIYPTARKKQSGTTQETVVDVLVNIKNVNESIKSGFSVKAKIETQGDKKVNIIPYDSVSQDESGTEFVYVYARGKVQKRVIKTGLELSEGVEVTEGITPNDLLVYSASGLSGDDAYVHIFKKS